MSGRVFYEEGGKRLVIGGDHAGFLMKGPVGALLRGWGHEVEDLSTHSEEPVDCPDIAREVWAQILEGRPSGGCWCAAPG